MDLPTGYTIASAAAAAAPKGQAHMRRPIPFLESNPLLSIQSNPTHFLVVFPRPMHHETVWSVAVVAVDEESEREKFKASCGRAPFSLLWASCNPHHRPQAPSNHQPKKSIA